MSDEDDFGGLAFGKRYKPDDGCDWTAVIIWEMRSKARIRACINTPRPVPARKTEVNGMHKNNQLKQSAQKLAEMLPGCQAETVLHLLETLEKNERHNAALSEAIGWAVSPERWIQREENIWEWRESPRGNFWQVLKAALPISERRS